MRVDYCNPWILEVERVTDCFVRINLTNKNTGEIKQMEFDTQCFWDLYDLFIDIPLKDITKYKLSKKKVGDE